MDGRSNRAARGTMAVVVRQFAPSRIERQLLAQAFELLCGRQSEAVGSHGRDWGAATAACQSTDEQAAASPNAGRAAA
jgi:hypothetical protein